jgi:Protein kinase domain
MESFNAMESIKDLVDPAYHVWLKPKKSFNGTDKKIKESDIFEVKKKHILEEEPKAEFKEALKELLNIPEICAHELKKATNSWDEKNILGRGGFGIVYSGEYLSTKVAIKKLEYREDRSGSSKKHLIQSLNELRHLNRVRHDNILPIYGYAFQDDGTCFVVYQLMPGKALDGRLTRRKGLEPLTWPERWRIARGTARYFTKFY